MPDNNSLQYDISIKTAQAKDNVDFLLKSINELNTAVVKTSKTDIKVFTQQFEKAVDPISEAAETIKILDSQIDKLKKKIRETVAIQSKGAAIGLERQLRTLERRRASAITAASQSSSISSGMSQVNAQYSMEKISSLMDNFQKQIDAGTLQKAKETVEAFERSLDPLGNKLYELQQAYNAERNAAINAAQANDPEEYDRATKEMAELRKEIDKLKNSSNKGASSWQKLLGRIKNISIYRAIRTAIKWITSGFREGLDNLVQYSDSVNNTMSNLNGSLNQIKNTMGIAFASVLQALEPLLTALADTIVNIVNSFNLAMAKMSGKNVYTKAKKNVDDYAKSLQKAQKFTFDTFEVLSGNNGQTSPRNMFEEVEISKDENSLSGVFEELIKIVQALMSFIGDIWNAFVPILSPLLQIIRENLRPLTNIVVKLLPSIAKLVSSLLPVIIRVVQELANVFIALTPVVIELANNLLPVIVHFLQFITDILKDITQIFGGSKQSNGQSKGFFDYGVGLYLKKAFTDWNLWYLLAKNLFHFAGGGFTTANFIATNENGRREWVGRNAGATAVVNDTQMSDIMYGAVRDGCYQGILQAMYDNGGGQSGNAGEVVLKVDANVLGRVVAESAGFRNEVNRRNVALNLR